MSDIQLNSDGDDIDLSTNAFELVEGVDAIAQHLLIRLRFFLSEWFLDQRLGVPYFQEILLKAPNLVTVRSLIREVVIETPGVEKLERFDTAFDTTTRKLAVAFTAKVTGSDAPLDFSDEFLIGG